MELKNDTGNNQTEGHFCKITYEGLKKQRIRKENL